MCVCVFVCVTSWPKAYTINTVGLRILPNKTVESGTLVGLSCEVSVSHDPSLQLTHIFQFLRYDVPVHSVNTTDTKALYKLSPARAADSGTYECTVTVMEKRKNSDQQKLTVTGTAEDDTRVSYALC